MLGKITLKVENILLDPNNPRFADISEENLNIPEEKYRLSDVQENAIGKMMHANFDVISLARSIETVGFIPVDSIVVRSIGTDSYVVVEGNRRVAAIKYILKQHSKGQNALTDEEIKKLESIEVTLITNSDSDFTLGLIIQGIRNVTGIVNWQAYQKAQFISVMIDKGKDPAEIGKMIGMSQREVHRYYKTYCAMLQFKNDEEYGREWKHFYFSYFDELLRKPALREFFKWDDDKYLFAKDIRRFYDWILPDKVGDEEQRTIQDAKEVRELANFISDTKALNYLDNKNFEKAKNYIASKDFKEEIPTLEDCREKISDALKATKDILSEGYYEDLTQDDIDSLEDSFSKMIKNILKIKKLKQND